MGCLKSKFVGKVVWKVDFLTSGDEFTGDEFTGDEFTGDEFTGDNLTGDELS